MDSQYRPGLDNASRPRTSSPRQTDVVDEESTSIHPEVMAQEPLDAGAPRSVLRPVEPPPPTSYARTREEKIRAIEQFAEYVGNIVAQEYGDWMRLANTYWWTLETELRDEPLEVRMILQDMHMLIQYEPSFHILETSRQILEMAMRIRDLLGADEHLEPKDFGIPEVGSSAMD